MRERERVEGEISLRGKVEREGDVVVVRVGRLDALVDAFDVVGLQVEEATAGRVEAYEDAVAYVDLREERPVGGGARVGRAHRAEADIGDARPWCGVVE